MNSFSSFVFSARRTLFKRLKRSFHIWSSLKARVSSLLQLCRQEHQLLRGTGGQTQRQVWLHAPWHLGLLTFALIWFMTKKLGFYTAGDVSAASQEPWILHTCRQKASFSKLSSREGCRQPEEEESSGLPVTYPIPTPCLPSEFSCLSVCKKDICPPS